MQLFLITRNVPEECLVHVRKEYEVVMLKPDQSPLELEHYLNDAVAILDVGMRNGAKMIASAGSNLKVYGTSSVGFDHIDVPFCTSKNVAVVNTPNSVMNATAEIAVGLMFDVTRRISFYDRQLREQPVFRTTYFPKLNQSLFGKTLGIVGFGRIGRCVAAMMKACGMKIVYYNTRRLKEFEEESDATYMDFADLLKTADIVSLHCPYRSSNHHMMNDETFALMKPSAYFINTARGKLVDEAALIRALKNQVIAGAGLDVFENEPNISEEFMTLDNVVVTPHIGTAAYDVRVEMVHEAIDGMLQILRGEMPHNILNPEVMARSDSKN